MIELVSARLPPRVSARQLAEQQRSPERVRLAEREQLLEPAQLFERVRLLEQVQSAAVQQVELRPEERQPAQPEPRWAADSVEVRSQLLEQAPSWSRTQRAAAVPQRSAPERPVVVDSSTGDILGARSLQEATASVVATRLPAALAAVRAASVPDTPVADRDTLVAADRGRDTGTDRGMAGPVEAADNYILAAVPIPEDRPCPAAESLDQPSQGDSPGASADLRVVAGSAVRSEVLS